LRIEYDPSRRPLIAISDAHLFPEPLPHPGREKLLAFLAGLAGIPAGRLWIAGDLFDFWFEYGGSGPPGHERILEALRLLSSSGWDLMFMPGNHDWWVGRGFSAATGAEIVRSRWARVGPEEPGALIAHGDGLGRGDWGYRLLLRPLIRSRVSEAVFALLPRRAGASLAGAASGTSRRVLRRQVERIPAHLSSWASGMLSGGCSTVVTGHTHVASRTPMAGGVHISLGDWLRTFTYASTCPGGGLRLFVFGG
jgi:UDP-2,3-diacylglucosamine hydrolase